MRISRSLTVDLRKLRTSVDKFCPPERKGFTILWPYGLGPFDDTVEAFAAIYAHERRNGLGVACEVS